MKCGGLAWGGSGGVEGQVRNVIIEECRVLRDAIPPTPPGPEGSNGNGLVRAQ